MVCRWRRPHRRRNLKQSRQSMTRLLSRQAMVSSRQQAMGMPQGLLLPLPAWERPESHSPTCQPSLRECRLL